jgi:hypothetical protein
MRAEEVALRLHQIGEEQRAAGTRGERTVEHGVGSKTRSSRRDGTPPLAANAEMGQHEGDLTP